MDRIIKAGPEELPLVENALLWAMRAWVIGHNRNLEIAARISRMFESMKVPEAAVRLDDFMSRLRSGAKRRLDIDCVCQKGTSADELLLLDIFALLQEGHEDEAGVLLARLIENGAVTCACCHALGLTLCLNAAGHFLPRSADAVRRHAFCHLTANHRPPPRRGLLN